jgi:isoleucyl-tRNA synthetase
VAAEEGFQARWGRVLAVREPVMKALEEQRAAKLIGSPLEARVSLAVGGELFRMLTAMRDALAEAYVVSRVDVSQADEAAAAPEPSLAAVPGLVRVSVDRAPGAKCARCWKYTTDVGTQPRHPQLCQRCVSVIGG